MPAHQKGKSGTRKYTRNKVKCAAYRVNKSRANKLLKLKRHLRKHVNDGCAIQAIERAG